MLRGEGALIALGATVGYTVLGASWGLFLLLLFVPDVFMIGYLKGARLGASVYNLGHTYVLPIALGAVALGASSSAVGAVALIWTVHIGLDRALGYGLKEPSGFRNTHLSPQNESPRSSPISVDPVPP